MKAKQIEKLLTGVMKNFLESIQDDKIKDIIKFSSFITGGCIPSMLLNEFVNDYDIYLHNEEDAKLIENYFETLHTTKKEDKYHVKLITENAINLSDKIQIITKFTGTPEKVTEKFDWKHIKSYYICNTEKLYLTTDVYQLVCEKELVYTGSDYPLSSMIRLKKYIKKGWNVSNTTILHIALDIIASFNKMEVERLNLCGVVKPTLDYKECNIINKKNEFNEDEEEKQTFNVDDIIHHLNGIDPLTVQAELIKESGKYLTISEIINIMNKE